MGECEMETDVDIMQKYSMLIAWSEEDGCFIVSVPDLPGCMADGDTPQETVTNAQVVIADWIETAQMLGREIPQPTAYDRRVV